jgi:hypothetical protein
MSSTLTVERIPLPVDGAGRRDEGAWHRLRAADYTASDMGALFGVGQRSTALAVYVRKAGLAGAEPETRYARRGHILEPVVADELRHRWPAASIKPADVYLRGRDAADRHMRVGATKDYDLERGDFAGPLEIKTVAPGWFRRWWCAGGRQQPRPPLDNVLQVRTQAMLDDADGGVLAVLVCDDAAPIFTFRIDRVPRIEDAIRRRVAAFWAAFEAGVLPQLELGREAKALDQLRRITRAPAPVLADSRVAELATAHQERTRAIAEATRELAAIEDEMRALMGDQAVVVLPDARRLTVGRYSSGRRIKIT